jgi:hypothetical protein
LQTRKRQCDDHELKFQRHTMQKEEDSQGSNSCPKPGTLVWEKALTLQVSSEQHLDNRVIRNVTLSSPYLLGLLPPPIPSLSGIHNTSHHSYTWFSHIKQVLIRGHCRLTSVGLLSLLLFSLTGRAGFFFLIS